MYDKDLNKLLDGNWHNDLPNGDVIIYNPEGEG